MDGAAAAVCVRLRGGEIVENRAWDAVSVDFLAEAEPWRTFRWHRGQKYYSGTYWSSTMRDHVIYESRLELARLLYADFDQAVRRILAQPFLLKTEIMGKLRKHIPDYLLITDDGPVVVDVKPRRLLSDSEVTFTFDWTRQLVSSRGWKYEVWSEPPPVELENIRFLAGYRRDWLFSAELADELRAAVLDGASLGQAVNCLSGRPPPQVRATIFHLLWARHLVADLDQPLCSAVVLRKAT